MGYVMLRRIQEINQLFIIGSVPAKKKLHAYIHALLEFKHFAMISLNKNPSYWEDSACINMFVLTALQHVQRPHVCFTSLSFKYYHF